MNGGRYIYILPFDGISSRFMEALLLEMEERLNIPFRIMRPIEVPEDTFHSQRKQYLSFPLLKRVLNAAPADAKKIIGVCNVDLYMPLQTFIFGQAQLDGTAAVVSVKRLDEVFYGRIFNGRLLFNRTLKEALHELGHTFGVGYCGSDGCVMSHSIIVEQVDQKNADFCPLCRRTISLRITMEEAPCWAKSYHGAGYWWLTTKRSCASLSRAGFKRMALR